MKNPFPHAISYIKGIDWRSRRTQTIAAGTAILIIILGFLIFSGDNAAPAVTDATPTVRVSRVADIMSGGSSLSVIAEITSVSEAKISPEAGGKITRVRASLGDFVGAGQVLAEIENSSQRAAVLQAEGSLDAAKASATNTGFSLESAKGSAVATILGAYAAMNSAVEDAVGQTLSDSESSNPSFTVSSRDTQAIADIERIRPSLSLILQRQEKQTPSLSASSDLAAELVITEKELRDVRAYLDIVIKALNAGVVRTDMSAATISGYVADATAARTAVTASLSAITAARASIETASINAGGGGAEVSSSEASIKQAQGAYNAALASLEKTIIRTPISGTLNNFTVKLGDTVSPAQQIAIVSNNGALEAIAYVTEEDKSQISVGRKVTLEGDITGTITRIAPALDPVTRRIEIRIGLPADALKKMTNGQSVRVELANESGEAAKPVTGPIAIPITALRMESTRTIVFVVENGKLVAKEIKIGRLSGDSVQVSEGLTMDSEIVVDARGRQEGETVNITN